MNGLFVFDACALIAFLNEEQGSDIVADILNDALTGQVSTNIHKINLLEVYYDVLRRCGNTAADEMLETVTESPINIINDISDDVLKEAGRLKATYRVSIADSVALAVASVFGGSLLTSDHHELDVVEKSESIKFHWIR